jgi:hypothetical protein
VAISTLGSPPLDWIVAYDARLSELATVGSAVPVVVGQSADPTLKCVGDPIAVAVDRRLITNVRDAIIVHVRELAQQDLPVVNDAVFVAVRGPLN